MSKIEKMERELIGQYIIEQLEHKDLSAEIIQELNMFKDIYVNNKSKNEVIEKYDIARTTLYRSKKKFLEVYSKGECYINFKSEKNKLTDEQNRQLEKTLKGIPLNVGIPYLRWSIDLIFYYIKSSFGVDYSKTNYYNIYNKNIKYIDDNEIIDYINKNYKCWYNIDVFYVNEKSNEYSIKNKKKRLKEEQGINYIANTPKSKYVYAAMAVDSNNNLYKVVESFTDFFIDNSMKQNLINSLLENFLTDDKILLIPMNDFLNSDELLELKERHRNIDFLIIDDKDEVSRIFRNDFEEIKNNIKEQIDDKKVGIHSNHNRAMEKRIKNS